MSNNKAAGLLEDYMSANKIKQSSLSLKGLASKMTYGNYGSFENSFSIGGSPTMIMHFVPEFQLLQQPENNLKPTSHLVDPSEGMVSLIVIQEGQNVNSQALSYIQKRKLEWSK